MLQVSVFEHLHLSSALGSSGRPGITSLEGFLQLSEDKQQQQEKKKTHGPNFPDAYKIKIENQSNTNTPMTIAIMYSTGKSFSESVVLESGRGAIYK
jgi:C4-type Zn-finger protein